MKVRKLYLASVFPADDVLETTDGRYMRFHIVPFRDITEEDLEPVPSYKAEGKAAFEAPSYLYEFYGLEKEEPANMKIIKRYPSFDEFRFSDPWVAMLGEDGKPDLSRKCGGYTGSPRMGEAGALYVEEPQEGAVYIYGQEDFQTGRCQFSCIRYRNGLFLPVGKEEIGIMKGTEAQR